MTARFFRQPGTPKCIGKLYVIESGGERFVANCIDESRGKPKRLRIQFDHQHCGEVVQPHQYRIMERVDFDE